MARARLASGFLWGPGSEEWGHVPHEPPPDPKEVRLNFLRDAFQDLLKPEAEEEALPHPKRTHKGPQGRRDPTGQGWCGARAHGQLALPQQGQGEERAVTRGGGGIVGRFRPLGRW